MVEVEGTDEEGQTVKAALVSLKPSSLPSVSKGRPKEHHMDMKQCTLRIILKQHNIN